MQNYKSVSAYHEIMDGLKRVANVFCYGPGFPGYVASDTIDTVIRKSGRSPDFIFQGHRWLSDNHGDDVDSHPSLNLVDCAIPKIGFLNKEYVNLIEKLAYFRKNRFDTIISHHHDTHLFSQKTGIRCIFWPFAVNHRIFNVKDSNREKKYDFTFSGVLKNQNVNSEQSDIRLRIQSKLFYSVQDIPIWIRTPYRKFRIVWRVIPRKRISRLIVSLLKKSKSLSLSEYSRLLADSAIGLNALSPRGLISTRFYECMASRMLVFCEDSHLINNIFPKDTYVTFRSDLSDFDEKLEFFINNKNERLRITDRAYKETMKRHTWEKRVDELIGQL